jgi:hypothetical protein
MRFVCAGDVIVTTVASALLLSACVPPKRQNPFQAQRALERTPPRDWIPTFEQTRGCEDQCAGERAGCEHAAADSTIDQDARKRACASAERRAACERQCLDATWARGEVARQTEEAKRAEAARPGSCANICKAARPGCERAARELARDDDDRKRRITECANCESTCLSGQRGESEVRNFFLGMLLGLGASIAP